MAKTLTVAYVRERFAYCPETGVLTWKTTPYPSKLGKPVGSLGSHGYLVVNLLGSPQLLHRIAWAIVHGEFPRDRLDHINRVRTDNRVSNLRACTHAQNLANSGLRRDNTSGRKGIFWDAKKKLWRAAITIEGKQRWLGRRKDPDKAAALYADAALKHYGAFALTGAV